MINKHYRHHRHHQNTHRSCSKHSDKMSSNIISSARSTTASLRAHIAFKGETMFSDSESDGENEKDQYHSKIKTCLDYSKCQCQTKLENGVTSPSTCLSDARAASDQSCPVTQQLVKKQIARVETDDELCERQEPSYVTIRRPQKDVTDEMDYIEDFVVVSSS